VANVIEELVARLSYEVDTSGLDEWQQGSEDAAESTEDLGEASEEAGEASDGMSSKLAVGVTAIAAIGAAAVIAATAVAVDLVTSFAEAGDEIAKTSRQIGVASDDLQELRFAAERSGVSNASLEKSLKLMQVGLFDAQTKGVGPFQEGLDALGISVDELDTLGPREQLGLFADALNNVDNEQKRTAISAKLFGTRAGIELKTLLQEGSEGIDALADRARVLGGVLGEDALVSAEQLSDSFTDLSTLATGLGNRLGTGLAPLVTDVTNRFTNWIAENQEFIDQELPQRVEDAADAARDLLPQIIALAKEGAALASTVSDVAEFFGDWDDAMEEVGFSLDNLLNPLGRVWELIKNIVNGVLDLAAAIPGLGNTVEDFRTKLGLGEEQEIGVPSVGKARAEAEEAATKEQERQARKQEDEAKKVIGGLREQEDATFRTLGPRRSRVRVLADKISEGDSLTRSERKEARKLGLTPPPRKGGGRGRGGGKVVPTLEQLIDPTAGQVGGGGSVAAAGAGVPAAGGGRSPLAGATITRIDASFSAPTEININLDASEVAGLDMVALADLIGERVDESISVTNRRAFDHYQQAVRP